MKQEKIRGEEITILNARAWRWIIEHAYHDENLEIEDEPDCDGSVNCILYKNGKPLIKGVVLF